MPWFSGVRETFFLTFLYSAVFFLALILWNIFSLRRDNIHINQCASKIVSLSTTDAETAFLMLRFVTDLTTSAVGLAGFYENLTKHGWTGAFYGALPFNLIPPSVVLRHGIAYTGPCGAKSKLLLALLRAAGIKARELNLIGEDGVPYHTLVEATIKGTDTPLDPTFGLHFADAKGQFIRTMEIKYNYDSYRDYIAKRFPTYPLDRYTYANAIHCSVHDVAIALLRMLRIVSKDYSNIQSIDKFLGRIIPGRLLDRDFPLAALSSKPRHSFLAVSAVCFALCLSMAVLAVPPKPDAWSSGVPLDVRKSSGPLPSRPDASPLPGRGGPPRTPASS